MSQLGGISGKIAIKKFQALGYFVVRKKGSHVRLSHTKSTQYKSLTIPMHKELKVGLLSQLIKDAHLTVEEFLSL